MLIIENEYKTVLTGFFDKSEPCDCILCSCSTKGIYQPKTEDVIEFEEVLSGNLNKINLIRQ